MSPSPLMLTALRVLAAFIDRKPPDAAEIASIRNA
jgi:hypothetical protein